MPCVIILMEGDKMTGDETGKLSKCIEIMAKFIHKYWNDLLSKEGKINQEVWNAIREEIINVTDYCLWADDVVRILQCKDMRAEYSVAEVRKLVTKSLLFEFIHCNHTIHDWMLILDWLDVHTDFFNVLKANWEINEDYRKAVENLSKEFLATPESIAHGGEKERIRQYVDNWKTEDEIQEFWAWGERDYFACDLEAFDFPLLFLPTRPDIFISLCTYLKAPSLLYELLDICKRREGQSLLELLGKAPSSIDKEDSLQWNRSFLAPALLHVIISPLFPNNLTAEREANKIEACQCFSAVADILNKRTDGMFLARSYMKFLSSPRQKYNSFKMLYTEKIAKAMHDNWINYVRRESLQSLFPDDIDKIKFQFQETGILREKRSYSICAELLANIQFVSVREKNVIQEFLPYIEASFMFDDNQFVVGTSAIPMQCHHDIGKIYTAFPSSDVVSLWEKTWILFSVARQRVEFSYYDENSAKLRRNLNFLLLIGNTILEQLFLENKISIMNKLWEVLWRILRYRLQYKMGADDEFNLNFAKYLMMWRVKYYSGHEPFKGERPQLNNISKQILLQLQSIETYPALQILSVAYILENEYIRLEKLPKEQRNQFKTLLMSSTEYYKDIYGERRLYELGLQWLKSFK